MKISIITVCLNAKDTIEETLLSIINQTYNDIELIVIDGASTDGTLEIIDKYKDRISHFISEPDSGIYDAMNKGIKLASGDFIFFLNANDVFYDEKVLENVVNASTENKDAKTQAKILFGDVEYISKDKKTSQILRFNNIKDDFSLILSNICHQCIFYHKSLFEGFGLYSNQFKIYSDWDFNIKCLVENKIQALYLPLIVSKFQLGGICSSEKNKQICSKEKKDLVKKYYPNFYFLIIANEFLRKRLGILYKILINITFAKKIAKAYCSQKKYTLNIKAMN